MAWRIHDQVVRGEIDNRIRDEVSGKIWLIGKDAPLELRLRGNCHRDVAGCVLHFENPKPTQGASHDVGLNANQEGVVGDMTASRKVRVLDVSLEEAMRMSKAGQKFPEHMGNSVYFEWFSETNGRVVIESADYVINISTPEWTLTEAETLDQARANQQAMADWMNRIGEAIEGQRDDDDPEDSTPMDEFAWEKEFKESDARTDKYMALWDKYENHPDRDKLIAREMGWEWLDEALEAKERGAIPEPDPSETEDLPPLEPDPLREGIDWVRDEDGDVHHPLQLRMFKLAIEMWRYCDEHKLIKDDDDHDARQMIFQAQMTAAKLAGALNGLAYSHGHEAPGFIVAALKRALSYLNQSLAGADSASAMKVIPRDVLTGFRERLHGVRQDILALMDHWRRQQK